MQIESLLSTHASTFDADLAIQNLGRAVPATDAEIAEYMARTGSTTIRVDSSARYIHQDSYTWGKKSAAERHRPFNGRGGRRSTYVSTAL